MPEPQLQRVYYDKDGRELLVLEVELDNRLGRDVRGKVTSPEGKVSDYSTSLRIFRDIWKETT